MVTGTIKRVEAPQATQVAQADPKQFVMVKNAVGGLTVVTDSYDYSVPARKIVFKFDQEKNYVTVKYALGVFVTPSALKQMELGYFTFEKLDILIKMAEDLGLYVPDSIKDPQLTLKDIAKILRSGDKAELERITNGMSKKVRADIIVTSQKMYDSLQQGTIALLEKKLGITLKPIDLSE